mmetsp:Transcript_21256/g.41609  ORF Transcript_21256/g.41609 Transcript_21256/m.41609 type:complete len:204 (+) Transcript_21256:505-1116(+)
MHPVGLILRLFDAVVAPPRFPVPTHLIIHKATPLPFLHVPILHELLPSRLLLLFRNWLLPGNLKHLLCRQHGHHSIITLLPWKCKEVIHQQLHRVSGIRLHVGARVQWRYIKRSHVLEVVDKVVLPTCGGRLHHGWLLRWLDFCPLGRSPLLVVTLHNNRSLCGFKLVRAVLVNCICGSRRRCCRPRTIHCAVACSVAARVTS